MLKGLRVIDLTTVALGPYATQTLGDFGAEIIKVESKEGDVLRSVRPGRRDDLGVGFLNFNRNKQAMVLDLKQPEGQAILHRLVETADVLVHNMRPDSAAGLGAAPEVLQDINPRLVYCYSPGFGGRGPDRDAPAYDDIIQARSGLASLNSAADGARTASGWLSRSIARCWVWLPSCRRRSHRCRFLPAPASRCAGRRISLDS